MSITLDTLPSKLSPYLLQPQVSIKFTEIDREFTENRLTKLKSDNILDGEKWIFKGGPRTGVLTTPDTHLYRVRKAKKIEAYIQKKGVAGLFQVPCKYLYWSENKKQFYVASEKIELSNEVMELASKEVKAEYKRYSTLVGQALALAQENPERALTPIQAETLAELAIHAGYTDLSYNNLYFTPDGKVAIIDTEPVKRGLNKSIKKNKIASWLINMGAARTQQALSGIAKLKLVCSNPEALQKVNKVEQKHVLWSLAKLVGKVTLAILVFYFIPTALALLPLGGWALMSLQATLKTIVVLKTLCLTINIITICRVWQLSHQGLKGVKKIVELETRGAL